MYVVFLLCCKVVGCSVFGVVGWGEGVVGKLHGLMSSKPGKFNVTF